MACDLLFRLRPNRKVYGAPPPYAGKGRKATHGALFRLSAPTIWPPPDEAWGVVDEKLGPLKIQRWDQQRFEDAPERPFTLLRVERVQARKTRRDPGVICLVGVWRRVPVTDAIRAVACVLEPLCD